MLRLRKPPRREARPGMKLHFLQALRAVAAWLVVADHALLEITHNDPRNWLTAIAWDMGSTGVYIFFVISGFIMAHISWQDFGRTGAPANFLRRRVTRIGPLYWLATIAAFAFHRVSMTHGADAGWRELLRSLLFIPDLDAMGQLAPVLSQGWTLSYEMMFYTIFAGALALRRPGALAAVGFGLGALTLVGPLLPPGVVAQLASPIVLWFVVGVALGAVWHWRSIVEPDWLARRIRFTEPFGDASYSTYLVHGFVLTIVFRIWTMLIGAPSGWIVAAGLICATIVGYGVHVVVERPVVRSAAKLWSLIEGRPGTIKSAAASGPPPASVRVIVPPRDGVR